MKLTFFVLDKYEQHHVSKLYTNQSIRSLLKMQFINKRGPEISQCYFIIPICLKTVNLFSAFFEHLIK